ncbi:hypothetical protein H0H93_006251 [Arthromyces matolae]|nr:hypothetical protein H0H93_006251 [Arthromyces matolae]
MADTEVLVPLSLLDQSWLESMSITLAYVVKTVDISALRQAAIRVLEKWRLLAGRVVWSKNLESWCIQVPLQGEVSDRLGFTTSKLAVRMNPSSVVNENAPAQLLTRPPLDYFRPASVPHDLQTHASSQAPIISIHVTELSNCMCIGILFPHGVFDAFGIRQFLHGLDCELHERPWDPPAFSGTNVLEDALNDLAAIPSLYNDIHQESATYTGLREMARPVSAINKFKLVGSIAYEHVLHNVQAKAVYLSGDAIQKLTQTVKEELKASGRGTVSTGDILVAWILKAKGVHETVSQTDHARKRVGGYGTDSHVYSDIHANGIIPHDDDRRLNILHTDNGVAPGPITPHLSRKDLAKKSLAELALIHRQHAESTTNVEWAQAYNNYLRKRLNRSLIFNRKIGVEALLVTNQTIARSDEINFGSKTYVHWCYMGPAETDHMISLRRFKDGFFIEGKARAARWRAVEEAVEELAMSRFKPRL